MLLFSKRVRGGISRPAPYLRAITASRVAAKFARSIRGVAACLSRGPRSRRAFGSVVSSPAAISLRTSISVARSQLAISAASFRQYGASVRLAAIHVDTRPQSLRGRRIDKVAGVAHGVAGAHRPDQPGQDLRHAPAGHDPDPRVRVGGGRLVEATMMSQLMASSIPPVIEAVHGGDGRSLPSAATRG